MARTSGSHSEITGPRILEAALKLFAESGYAAVSMRKIASEVGVQVGALYNYTPDKQSLLFGLMRDHMEKLVAAWDQETRPDTPMARLEHFARFHVGYHHVRRDAVFIAYMELRNLTPENFAVIEGLRSTYEGKLEDILEEGARNGSFSVPDAKIASMALIAMLTGVNTWFRETGRLPLEEVQDIYWEMTRKAVTA
ncbi:TetR/AcrR family transcriptional regulator [Cognatishimia activa]|uniref:HTH-type transcriptional repressor KstR2 n=1 Tax=Cognatishimia activa TaxID=1715691 RepID=A0A0P1IQF3_9RHOB|nr:TetR/AcrR family transcriptional regulator [Cognatishimia activa]CUI84362.1 HTH-type transcriptional repressor KstR2 [Cognatishimia activa]CUK25699.1 HTH-type transcriptional repressor KstR2 [Cognatishimia activa]